MNCLPTASCPIRVPFLSTARAAALAAALLAFGSTAHAQLYWDANGGTAGFGTATGTWAAPTTNDATQGWSSSSTGATLPSGTTTTTTTDALNFGTSSNQLGTGTITVSGNVSANTLTFVGSSSNIILSGGNITMGTSSQITVTNSANTSAITETISSNITLGGTASWTVNNGGTVGTALLNVSGNVLGGANGLTKYGNGTLTLSGAANSWNGTTTVSVGTMSLSGNLTSGGSVFVGSASGGVLNVTGNLTQTKAASPRNFQITNGSGQTGTVNVSGSGIINSTGLFFGDNGGGNATLNISGGTFTNSGETWLAGSNNIVSVSGGTFTAQNFELGAGIANGISTVTVNGTGAMNLATIVWARAASSNTTLNLGTGSAGGNLSISGISWQGGSNTINFNGGTLTTSGAITISSANAATVVKSGGAVFNVASNTLTISGNLTTDGTGGGLTKNGSGTLTLSGTNTYTGATTINAGTLSIGSISNGTVAGTLGNSTNAAGNLVLNGGELAYTGSNATTDRNFTLGAGTTSTINVTQSATSLTLTGAAANTSGALTKNGSGTLILSGVNAYTGATRINAGTLQVDGSGRLGGGSYSGNIANSGTFLYNGTNSQTLSGVISGTGALTKSNTGTLTLAGNNTYTGATTVSAGTLNLTGSINGNLTTASGGTFVAGAGARVANATFTAGTANATNALTVTNRIVLAGGINATLTGGTSFTAQGANLTNSSTARTLTLSGGTLALNNGVKTISITNPSFETDAGTANYFWYGPITGWTVSGSGSIIEQGNGRIFAPAATPGYNASTNFKWAALQGAGNFSQTITVEADGNYTLSFAAAGRAAAGPLDLKAQINGTDITAQLAPSTSAWTSYTSNSIYLTAGTHTLNFMAINRLGSDRSSVLDNVSMNGTAVLSDANLTIAATSSSVLDFGYSAGAYTIGALNLTAGGSTTALTLANGTTLTLAGDASNNAISATGTSGQTASIIPGTNAPSLVIAAGKNISVDSGVTLTVQSAISGNSAVNKIGAGTLALTGNNTYTGTTTITAGTIEFGASGNQTLSGVISGSGGLTKSNTGTMILSGNNTYAGTTTINGGTLQIGVGGTSGSISSSNAIVNNGTLTINRSDTVTQGTDFANSITGSGGLIKSGTNTLVLGTNTYTGATTVNGGTLQLSGNITSSALTVGTGGIISIGNTTTAAKANASSITLQGGSGYAFTIGNVNTSVAGTDYDQLTATGALTLSNTAANPFTIYLNGTPTGWSNTGTYSWDLISAASLTGFNSGNFTWNFDNFGIAGGNRTGTWDISNPSGGIIRLSYAAATPNYYWSGTSGNWTTGFTPSQPITDKNLFFIGALGGTATNNISNSTLSSLNFITFNSTAGSYTLAAAAGSAGASGGTALTVKGDITNNSANAQTINMDLALVASSTGIFNTAAGNITIGGVVSGVSALTKQGNSTLILGGNNTYSGATIISGGTLQVGTGGTSGMLNANSTITNNGTLAFKRSNTVTQGTDFASVLTGAGNFAQAGTGTLLLNGNNTYTGSTTISAGTLEITSTGRLGGGNYSGNIANNGVLIYSGSNAQTLGGAISGTGALTHNNTSTLTLSGNNTYSGATTIAAGTLEITSTGRLGGGNYSGNIVNNGTFLYNGTNNQTLGGILSGTGALTKNNTGTLTLNGANTSNAAITINGGSLQVGSAGLLGGGSYSGNLAINGTSSAFIYSGTSSQALGGRLSGNGGFTVNGTGALTLSADTSSYTGNTTVNGGSLILGTAGRGNMTVTSGGMLTIAFHNYLNTVTSLTLTNGGILNMSGAQGGGLGALNMTDATVTGSGYLRGVGSYNFSGNNSWGGANLDVSYGATLNVTNGTMTMANAFGTNVAQGIVTKTGNGTLALSAANSYTAGTILNAGTLALNNATAIGTGALTINGGSLDNTSAAAITLTNNNTQNWNGDFTFAGTKDLNLGRGNVTMNASRTVTVNSGTLSVYGNITGAGFGLTKNGSGTLTLNGSAMSYTGARTVNAGTLRLEATGATSIWGSGNSTINVNNGSTLQFGVIPGAANNQATFNSGMVINIDNNGGATIVNDGLNALVQTSNTLTINSTGGAQNLLTRATTGGTTGYWNNQSGNGTILFNVASGTNATADMRVTGFGSYADAYVLTKNGTGKLLLETNNTFHGFNLNNGSVEFGGTGNFTTSNVSASFVNNGTFTYNSTGTGAISTNITGTGAITQRAGTLTINGSANTYNGATTVSGGTLALGSNITSSALTLNSGGVISVGTNSTLATINKVNTASITINGGSGYAVTIGNVGTSVAGTDYDQLTATGALTLNNTAANPFTIYLNGTPTGWSNAGNYTWTIISAASQTGFSPGNFTLDFNSFGIAGSSRTGTWAFANPSGGNITLAYSAPTVADAIWSGGAGNWNAGFTPSVATDANIFFTGTGGTATNNIIDSTLSSVNFITFNSTAGAYTLAANANSAGAATPLTVKGDIINNSSNATGQTISMNLALLPTSTGIVNTASGNITLSGNISGVGGITKSGASSLTLSGANTYNGTTTINTGTVFITSNTALGSAAAGTTINGGKLVLNGAGMNISENITIDTTTSNGDIQNWANGTISGLITLRNAGADIRNANSATLTLTGGITSAFNRSLNFVTNAIINTTPITIGTGVLGFQGGASQLNVAGNTFGSLDLGWNGNLTLGVSNAITSTANVRFGGNILVNNAFTLSLNGTNQTVAGVFQNPSWAVTDGQNQNITGGGVLTINQTTNATTSYGGRITDGATATSLVKNGNGTLMLQNWSGINSSYSGATTINAGTLMILAGNGTSLSSNSAYTVASGAALTLGGNSTVAGPSTAIIGSLAGAGTVQNGNSTTAVTLTTGGNNGTTTFSGVLQNGGAAALALTKNGTGTFTLSGNNTYSGATTINAGTLEIGSTGRLGGGSYAGAITNNGSLLFGSNSNQTLSGIISGTGALTKNGASTLTLSNTNTYSGGTTINTGTIILSGANAMQTSGTVNSGATLQTNRDDAIQDATAITLNGGTLALQTYNDYIGNLTLSNNAAVTGTGTGTQSLINNGVSNSLISTNGTGNAGTISSRISLTSQWGAATGARTQQIQVGDNATLTISGVIQDAAPNSPAFAGSILKSGNGTLTFSGNNTYTGTTTINAGTIEIGATGRLGAGTYAGAITNNATLIYSGTNNQTLSGAISGTGALTHNASSTLTLSNNNTYSGATTINAGTIEIAAAGRLGGGAYSGNIANSGLLIYSGTNNQTLSGMISGNGALTQNNTGTLTLSGNNNYTGTTTINAGTLAIGANMTLGVLAGTGNLSLGNGFTLTTNTSTANTFSGLIIGSGSLTKNGTGWLTLGGNNSYAGATTINAGTLEIGAAGRLGGGSYSGNIVTGSSSALLLNSGTNNQLLSGIISGSGGVAHNAASTLTLTGNNTYTGATTIYDGTLEIGAAGRLGGGSYSGDIDNSGVLIYSGTNNQTLSGIISSVGALTHNASSMLTLGGNNTYTGTTTINTGTLQISTTGLLGAGNHTGNIVNNGAFVFGSNLDQILSGNLSGTGSLTKSGSGVLTLTGTSSFNGATTISAGTLVVNGSAANSAVTIGNGGILGGNGTVGALTVQSGGRVAPGNSPGNLQVSTLTLEGGGGYNWEINNVMGTAGTNWDMITVGGGTGAATINATSGNKFTVYISGNPTGWDTNTAYDWNIIDWGAVSGFDATAFAVDTTGFTGTAPIGTWSFSNSGGYLNLAYTVGDPTWNGGTGNWTTGFTPNLTGGNMSIYFAGNNTATATNNIASATVGSVASITFNSTAGAYTLAANSGSAGYDTASALELNGNIVNNSTATQTINLALTSNATRVYDAAAGNITIGGAISGTGGLTKNGSGTLALSGNNTYTGDTTINSGTLAITGSGKMGGGNYTGNIMCNTGGTLLYASSANQSYAWIISGAGGIFMNGTASNTLALTGNNSFTGSTTINSGTLKAGAADALGDTSEVNIDGGSLLIAASEAINDAAAIDLNGGRIEFEGNVTEHLGAFTLLANSTIDMGMGSVWLEFANLAALIVNYDLKIYNYTLYTDHLYFASDQFLQNSLTRIKFYSGTDESSFIGNSFIESLNPYHVRPVPEPETYATAALLLLGLGIYAYRRRQVRTTT